MTWLTLTFGLLSGVVLLFSVAVFVTGLIRPPGNDDE